MKVDRTQFLDFQNKINPNNPVDKVLSEKIVDLVFSISYVGPVGRMEFDTKDFYSRIDNIYEEIRKEYSYYNVCAILPIIGDYMGRAISVGENSHSCVKSDYDRNDYCLG
jgi:hypothetical protein